MMNNKQSQEKLSEVEVNDKITSLLRSLSKKKVEIIEQDGWSTEEEDYDSRRYNKVFYYLQDELDKRIRKHFNLDKDADIGILAWFDQGKSGKWYGNNAFPDVTFTIDRVLKGDFSELKTLKDYAKEKISA